jgi:hypothetical protein
MNRNQTDDLATLATVFYNNLTEDSTWQNPFAYDNWKPNIVMDLLGEEAAGEFSELHQDSLTEEQRQYAYSLYKGLPDYLREIARGKNVFYIDAANLPDVDAEQFILDAMATRIAPVSLGG